MLNLALETREAYNVHYNYYDTNLNTITFKIDCNQVKVKWKFTCISKEHATMRNVRIRKLSCWGNTAFREYLCIQENHLLVHVVSSYTSYAYIINVNHNSISTRYTFTHRKQRVYKNEKDCYRGGKLHTTRSS